MAGDDKNFALNFSGGRPMSAPTFSQSANTEDDDAPSRAVAKQSAPATNAGLGGMSFGQAISPGGSKEDHEYIDQVARSNEDFAIARMYSASGNKALKNANPQLLQVTAPKYAELYAVAGKEIDETTQQKIDRLAALETHTAKTAGLGLQFQTAPVQANREIAKLRSELDKDTLQIRTQAQRTEMAKARLTQRMAEDDLADRDISEKFDNYTPRQLQSMLTDEGYKKIHPDATRMTIIDKLKEFKEAGDPELSASEMTPERRKAVINSSLGMLTPRQRREVIARYEADGPMAFVETNHAEKMLPGPNATPEQIAQFQQAKDAEDQRNSTVRQYARYFGGMVPTMDEAVTSLMTLEDNAAKLNLGPEETARRQRQAQEFMRIEVTKADATLSNLSKLGLAGEAESVTSYLQALSSLEMQEATAKKEELPIIREKKKKLIDGQSESIRERIKMLSDAKEVQLAAENFTKTGEVIGKKDGDALLAYALRNTQTETSQQFYEHRVTTPSGITQVDQLPLANPTSSALSVMRGQVDKYLQDLNAIDDPVLKSELKTLRSAKAAKGSEVGIAEYDDEMYATVMRHISKTDVGRKAREMYASVSAQQVLTLALNNVVGDSPEDRQLFAEIVKSEPRGTVLNDRYLTKSSDNSIPVPNMAEIADRLTKANRSDILERLQTQMSSPELQKTVTDKLAPQTLTEKAMFAHMFGNTASVTLSNAGTAIGRLHFSQYLSRNVVGSISRAIVQEKVAAPKRNAQEIPAGFDQSMIAGYGELDAASPYKAAPRVHDEFMKYMQR
jgi:hypothetical protein